MRIENVGFIILAGGKSSRMGRDKADLAYGGRTFLEQLLDKADALGFSEVLVSGYRGENAHWRENGVQDVYKDRGPLGGLHACLRASKKAACFVCSVDVPALDKRTIEQMVAAHEPGGATLARSGQRVEPLIGVYDTALEEAVAALIKEGPAPVMRLLDRTDCRYFDVQGNADALHNINTPAEYERLLQNCSEHEQY